MTLVTLPARGRGRQTPETAAAYDAQVAAFCAQIRQIRARLDFDVSSRGWCYILENMGILRKGDFDRAQALINEWRKGGQLPVDICADDAAREFVAVEELGSADPAEEAGGLVQSLWAWVEAYTPFSFWDDKPVYIQMLVEKIDLRELFKDVCARYRVPLANARGNADLNTRAELMRRFAEHERAGRRCVLLYCGDHDPAGLRISDQLHNTLADMSAATGWDPARLEVFRFGLNADFIAAHGLTWVDNLATGSGGDLASPHHADHNKAYVQDYLALYGARKVEANALVVRPEAGRRLCEEAILRYLGDRTAPARYERELGPWRETLAGAVRETLAAA